MARKRLYAKRTTSAEYEQIDLFGLLEVYFVKSVFRV